MNTNLYVTAKFKVKKEKINEAIALMRALTDSTTQNEKGCISYYYLQNNVDDSEFTSFEIWENETEEANHWATPHVQNALSKLPELLEVSPEIIKWKSLN